MASFDSSTPLVTFDAFSKIRILESSKFEASEHLKEECKEFIQKITEFNELIKSFLVLLQEKATEIEKAKLKAIGHRNCVETEAERRDTEQARLKSMIKERQAELDRLVSQYESLIKVEQDQIIFIETLSNK